MNEKDMAIIRRFFKGFVAGFVSSLGVQLSQIPVMELTRKQGLLTLLVGSLAGGILAVEKLLRWEN